MANTHVWREVLAVLERNLSKPAFQTWLQGTTLEITNHVWTIMAANEFAADWLEDRYGKVISEAIQAVHGEKPTIQFSYDERKEEARVGAVGTNERQVTEGRLQYMEEEMMAMRKQIHRLETELAAIKNS
ncbi:hypothetical protein HUG15_04625 [Salicibibacter cibarius]|uniref:DnaA N-terminal domain-containing protein n=1 Tax=Salicibibacter cibarius TaxID=2743000 RepID=A0A7T6Z0X0_9BACI|nr:DnaA N-terminal domain-containing protein [Salicibibacter cibarius]QQK74955.1 hypothetical protein HUG15_04625 [Salicibibacter cibarius]